MMACITGRSDLRSAEVKTTHEAATRLLHAGAKCQGLKESRALC